MNVLIATGIFPPAAGGPATYSKMLADELTKRGHEVKVITYGDRLRKSEIRNQKSDYGSRIPISAVRPLTSDLRFSVVRITRSRFKLWHYYKYYRAVKKYGRDADVLYAQDPVSAGYPTYLAAKALKKPYVVKVTGDYSWEQAQNRALTDKLIDEFQLLWRSKDLRYMNESNVAETFRFPKKIKRIRDVQIRVCREANAVVTPSEYLKRIVMGWGVKEKRIQVIYNAVREIKKFNREAVRQELGISEQDFVILSLGRNVPWKGFELLREVVDDLFSTVIPRLDRGIQPHLRLVILHDADRQTINKYFRAADLFVLNTGYEGFSHTILEAMSAGLPVITTRVGGNPEIVNHPLTRPSPARGEGERERVEANGILIEYNNKSQLCEAILKLYNDSQLRKSLIENGKKILSKFTLENMINQTETLLKTCAS